MKLTTHFHVVPSLGMSRGVPLFPLRTFMALTGKTLAFFFKFYDVFYLTSVLFWDITRRCVVILYGRFRTTCRSHLYGSRVLTRPETSVNNYHTTPCNIPEERRSYQHRGGSLKSRSFTWTKTSKYFVQNNNLLNSLR